MIPLIPALAAVGAISLGMLVFAGTSLLEIQDLHSDASANTQERLQERLHGEYEGTPTNIQQAVILSEWTDSSTITAILVKCDDGKVFTIDVEDVTGSELVVNGGELNALSQPVLNAMANMSGSC